MQLIDELPKKKQMKEQITALVTKQAADRLRNICKNENIKTQDLFRKLITDFLVQYDASITPQYETHQLSFDDAATADSKEGV